MRFKSFLKAVADGLNMEKIYDNVQLGENAQLGSFIVIGEPPRGKKDGELSTQIGTHAVIRAQSVIYAGNRIGDNFQTGHGTVIREENEIGNNVSIGTLSVVEHHVKIADGVRIHSQAFIPEYSVLEENCWIGPNVVLTNAKYPVSKNVKQNLNGPIIGKNAKIGANTTILPGVEIGENALIGSGSVVTKNIPANMVAVGNPAQIVKQVSELQEGDETAYTYE